MKLEPIPANRYDLCAVGGCGNTAVYDGLVPSPVDGTTGCFEVTVCANHEWPNGTDCRDFVAAFPRTDGSVYVPEFDNGVPTDRSRAYLERLAAERAEFDRQKAAERWHAHWVRPHYL